MGKPQKCSECHCFPKGSVQCRHYIDKATPEELCEPVASGRVNPEGRHFQQHPALTAMKKEVTQAVIHHLVKKHTCGMPEFGIAPEARPYFTGLMRNANG